MDPGYTQCHPIWNTRSYFSRINSTVEFLVFLLYPCIAFYSTTCTKSFLNSMVHSTINLAIAAWQHARNEGMEKEKKGKKSLNVFRVVMAEPKL